MEHRRIALLLSNRHEASLLVRERGFQRAVETHPEAEAASAVLLHDKTLLGIGRAIDSGFRKSPHPIALVVAEAWHALTAVSHLVSSGYRVREDVSVVCTDFELFLQANNPQIAGYMVGHIDYTSHLSRLVIQLAQVGLLPPKPNWIVPYLRPGGTIGRPRT